MRKTDIERILLQEMPYSFNILNLYEKKLGYTTLERRNKKYCGCCGNLLDICECKGIHRKVLEKYAKTKSKQGYAGNSFYYMTTESHNNILVLRYFLIWLYEEIGKEHSDPYCSEVMRIGIDEKGHTAFVRKQVRSSMWQWDWEHESKLEPARMSDRYYINAYAVGSCRKPKWCKYIDIKACDIVNDELVKMLNNCWSKTYAPVEWLKDCVENQQYIETMIKCKRYDLLAYRRQYGGSEIVDNALMLLLRHNKKLPNATNVYKDYINGLNTLNRDLRNIKVVCPEDFEKANKSVNKLANKIKAEETLIENIKNYNDGYVERIGCIVGVDFGNEKFSICILPSIRSFKDEADSMCHCVYRMGYYKDNDSFIFSVRNRETNKRIETAELKLDEKKKLYVKQCYGYADRKTSYHDDIVALLNSKLKEIRGAIRQ